MSTQFDTKSVFTNKRLRKDLRDGLADTKGAISKKIAGALPLTEKEATVLKAMLADRDGDLTAKLALGIKEGTPGTPSVPAVAASYTGTPAGAATAVTITASVAGVAGNSISVAFDGTDTIQEAIDAHNLATPSQAVTLTSGSGSQVPTVGSVSLSGGSDLVPAVPGTDSVQLTEKEQALLLAALADQPRILSEKIIAGEDFSA